jgi:uncharacterized protein
MDYTKAFDMAFKHLSEDGEFEGYPAVFNNVDRQNDKISRKAFLETIEESGGKWVLLMGHDSSMPIGFTTHAEEDNKGLFVRGEFTLQSSAGRDAYQTVKHAIALKQKFGMSFGYSIRNGGVKYDEQKRIRTLLNLTVYECSLASVPANPHSELSRVKEFSSLREAERLLCDATDWTGDEARRFISFLKSVERDAKPVDGEAALERDAKELQDCAAADFMAALRQFDFSFRLKELTK